MQISIGISVKGTRSSGPPAPVNTVAPVISGSTSVGSVLTTTNGTWTNSPVSFAYQWKRGATNIGTNASTYTLVVADTNQAITCVVTATNAGGSTPATSNTITADNPFISTFRTTASSETVTLPYEVAGTYSGTISWGDGSTSTNSYANRIHTYAVAGDYVITVTGVTTGFRFNVAGDRLKIRSIQNWGTLRLGNSNGYFFGCTNLTLTSVNGVLDTTGTTTFNNAFRSCTSLTTINNINSWNTSAVTNMTNMFSFATLFNQALSFNTSSATNMAAMFQSATAFNSALNFNTSAVTTMSDMFNGATSFNQALSFNTGAVTNMANMFQNASAFNQPLSFNTGAVTNMSVMFQNASAFNSTLTFTSTALVTNMGSMFQGCTNFNQPINFNTIAVTSMGGMFQSAVAFNQPLTFNTSAVTLMNSMFQSATAFNSALTFSNTAIATTMASMFAGATAFNQALNFDTIKVTTMSSMFSSASAFNQAITFNTIAVNNMANMFANATAFDQDIGALNVANVINFTGFMLNKTNLTFSTTNLDAIYNGWSLLTVKPNIIITFGTAQYTSAATASKFALENVSNWTITDGGEAL